MMLARFFSSALTGAFLFFAVHGYAQLQVSLNANPLDPFPPNSEEIMKLAQKIGPLAEALQHFRQGNADKLKESLLQARQVNPEFPKMDVMMARLFMANGQWQDAMSVLENHVTLNANDAEAYKNFAEIAMVSGRWTDAWLELEKAASLVDGMAFSPQRKQNFISELTKMRAEVAEMRQDIPLATKLFEELAKQQPMDGTPFWNLGQIKIRTGDIEGGLALLKKGRQLTTTLPQPELIVARVLAAGKDRTKADEWFRKGIQASDGSVSESNWLQYLQFLLDDNRVDDAQKLVERVPADYQKSREMRLIKAIIHRFAGKNAEAEKLLSALHQENSDDLIAADHLALVLVESSDEGKRARAEQLSEANVRRAPNAERAVATAAWIKFKTGSTDIADQVLGQILRGGRLEPQTAYYAAMLLKSRGMKDEYLRFLRASVAGNGSFPQKNAAQKELASLDGSAIPAADPKGTESKAPATSPDAIPKK
jgi:thioredoxin-like negative regulator of GroEL